MRRGIILTWLVGEGIIIYRAFKKNPAPPMPGELLVVSALFAGLALLGEVSDGAAQFATLLGAGLDIAAAMNLFESGTIGKPPAKAPPKRTRPGTPPTRTG